MTSGRDEPRKRRGRGKADANPDEELGWLAELRGTGPDKPARPRDEPESRGDAPKTEAIRPDPPKRGVGRPDEPPKTRDRSTKDAPAPVPPAAHSRRPAPAPAPGPPPRAASAAVPPDLRPPPPSPPTGPTTTPPLTGRPSTTGPGGMPAALTRQQRPPTAPRQTAATAGTPAKAVRRGRSPERVENTWGGHDTAGGTGELFSLPPDGTGEFPRSGRGAQALAKQRSQVSMLRVATLILVALAVVGAPAAFFVIREFTQDPVFVELDNLGLPAWAAGKHTDDASGSRWCVDACRLRQRTWQSARGTAETDKAYVAALTKAGWTTWNTTDCQADGVGGVETCWQRDEYVLDLWVRPVACETKPVRPTIGPNPAPSTAPSAGPGTPACAGSVATVKVVDRISYQQAATS